jgi:hypothetical protein
MVPGSSAAPIVGAQPTMRFWQGRMAMPSARGLISGQQPFSWKPRGGLIGFVREDGPPFPFGASRKEWVCEALRTAAWLVGNAGMLAKPPSAG